MAPDELIPRPKNELSLEDTSSNEITSRMAEDLLAHETIYGYVYEIEQYLVHLIYSMHGVDVSSDPMTKQRIWECALDIEQSKSLQTYIDLPFLTPHLHFKENIRKSEVRKFIFDNLKKKIRFKCTVFEQALRQKLGIQKGHITRNDMLKLDMFRFEMKENQIIRSISGIEHAIKLREFHLVTKFASMTPLKYLSNLKSVYINNPLETVCDSGLLSESHIRIIAKDLQKLSLRGHAYHGPWRWRRFEQLKEFEIEIHSDMEPDCFESGFEQLKFLKLHSRRFKESTKVRIRKLLSNCTIKFFTIPE